MRAHVVRGLLIAKPFRPFTIKVVEGDIYHIGHPESISVTKDTIYIGEKGNSNMLLIDLLHVIKVELTDGLKLGFPPGFKPRREDDNEFNDEV